MNGYIIMDGLTLKIYGIAHKRWLMRLFVVQRHDVLNKNLIIQKSNEIGLDAQANDNFLHYFSGFALTNREIEFISYQLTVNKFGHSDNEKIASKKINRILRLYNDKVLPEYVLSLIQTCIHCPAAVDESLSEKYFLYNIMNERW